MPRRPPPSGAEFAGARGGTRVAGKTWALILGDRWHHPFWLERRQPDQTDHTVPFEQEHGVDVRPGEPGAEVEVGRLDTGMALARPPPYLAPGHGHARRDLDPLQPRVRRADPVWVIDRHEALPRHQP